MTVKLRGPGGVIEVSDATVDRFLGLGYSKVETDPDPTEKAEPSKPRAKSRKKG